jgi:hypothetical protein
MTVAAFPPCCLGVATRVRPFAWGRLAPFASQSHVQWLGLAKHAWLRTLSGCGCCRPPLPSPHPAEGPAPATVATVAPGAPATTTAPLQSPRLVGLYPPSYEMTEPLTKPHTVSVLVLLVMLVGYTGISGFQLATGEEEGAPSVPGANIANKFTNIKT